jgi:type I phosphodiesterase/nucleotide pyrophosphatase
VSAGARTGAVALLLLAVLVGTGLAARAVGGRALSDFTAYDTPFAFPPVEARPGPPLARQVVLVLVDGLGLATSKEMPALNALRARGADLDCVAGLPSLSLPGRAVMLSGAWQEVSGQTTNYHPRPLRVEHVFSVARREGLTTALAAGEGGLRLFAPAVQRPVEYPKDPETAPFSVYEAALHRQAAASRALLEQVKGQPGFVMLELHAVDEAGHGWGASSAEYRKAALDVDEIVRGFLPLLDLSRDTLVVTADHGHVATGGHGGAEPSVLHVPLVLAGAGIRAGTRGACRQVDLAPTLCVLLGLPAPSSNQGRPLLDALDLDPARRVQALRAAVAQREHFAASYRRVLYLLDGKVPHEDPFLVMPATAGEPALVARLDELDHEVEMARQARSTVEVHGRMVPALLLVLLPPLAAAVLVRARALDKGDVGRAILAAGIGVLLYYGSLPLLRIAYSMTAVNKDEWLPAFFRKDMSLGIAACALSVLLGALSERRLGRRPIEIARSAWLVTAAFCYLFVVKMALVYWRQGLFPRWRLADLYWSFGFYLDVLVVVAVGLASPLMALPAWAAGLWRSRAAAAARDL